MFWYFYFFYSSYWDIGDDKKPENTDIKAGLVYILKVNSKKPWAPFRLYRIYICKQNAKKNKANNQAYHNKGRQS